MNYFDLLPVEINTFIIVYSTDYIENKLEILDLWQISQFKSSLISKLFWLKLFDYNCLPILNKDLFYHFHGDRIANKKFVKYTNNQLIKIILMEYLNVSLAMESYQETMNKKFDVHVPFNYLHDMSILYNNVNFEKDTENILGEYWDLESDYFRERYGLIFYDNKWDKNEEFIIIQKFKKLSFGYGTIHNSIKLPVKDKKKFCKELLVHIFYHRAPIDIHFHNI